MVGKWIEEFLECFKKAAQEENCTVSHDLDKDVETLAVLLWHRRDGMYDVTYRMVSFEKIRTTKRTPEQVAHKMLEAMLKSLGIGGTR